MKPELVNSLVLAYLGDSVFEVLVREFLIVDLQIAKVDQLQKTAVKYVSAKAQAAFMFHAIKEEWLTEKEVAIYKRGRNTKGRSPKNMSVQTHNQSTGFEAVIGHLYLEGNIERIKEIFKKYYEFVEKEEVLDD